MTDWTDHLTRSRRHLEPLFWVLAAATVAMLAAASAALALWLDPAFGRKDAETRVVVIDLTTLPQIDMVAAEPPRAESEPVVEPVAEPEPEPERPPPEPEPEPRPPEPEPAPQPKADPVPAPEPPPLPTPAPKPKPKPKAEPAKPQPKKAAPKPAPKPAEAAQPQPNAAAAAPVQGSAQASAMAKWKRKVQGQMAGHVKRKRLGSKAKLVLSVQIDGAGQMTDVSVRQSSGDAALDAKVAAHARARGSVAAPPDGKGTTLILPITLG